MNKKTIYLIAFAALLFLSTVTSVSAQTQIGVSPDNSYTYAVTSNSYIPSIFGVISNPGDVQTLTVNIQTITSPNIVTLNLTQQYKNGTTTSIMQSKDLTSALNFPMTFTNLNVGDKLWSSETLSPIVNDTVTVTFSSASRQINHASIGPQETGYDLVAFSFDRQTGMPTELRYVESDDFSTTLTLTNTNVWTIPEFTNIPLLIGLVAIVSLGITVVYKRLSLNKTAICK